MKKGRIYILPTRFGAIFLLGACVMLLVGATYQNNLVNLLAFFMMSLIFVAMVQTHNNLKDIRLEALETESGFAGGQFVVTSILKNVSREPRFHIETSLRKRRPETVYDNVHPLLPRSSLKLRSAYRAERRGHYVIGEMRLSTVYPLGLFHAWIWLEASTSYFVYPEVKGARALPMVGIGDQEELTRIATTNTGDDFQGHRRYEQGDSHRHVDWKARARGRPLLVKEFNEGTATAILLDWNSLEGLDEEQRLSQLATWIEEAKARRLSYALKLPGATIGPSTGLQHATRCLEVLATYGERR